MMQPILPAGTPSTYIPVKLMNVPVMASLVVEQQLCSFWSEYGEVIAIAPHMYKGLPLQSNHWDMVLKVKADTPLSATPFFDVLRFKVMASWPGSEKACPRCKQVGHDSHSCPRRPAAKQSKKRSSSSKQPSQPIPTPKQTLPTSSLTAIPVTVDAADMDEDS